MFNVRMVLGDEMKKKVEAVKNAYPDEKITHQVIYKAGLKALKNKLVKPE